MSNAFTGAGTELAIADELPETFDDEETTGYPSLTWKTVGEITSVPEHGAEYALVTHNPLGERITVKRKGSVNFGSVTIPMALDTADEGQDSFREYADGTKVDDSAPIRITLANGAVRYFTAQVMSFQEGVDDVDSITSASTQLEIDREVIYVGPE